MGDSSFSDQAYRSVTEMPFDLFNVVLGSILTSGKLVKTDGSCHR